MLYMRDIVVESPQEKGTRRISSTLCHDEHRKSNIDEQGRKKDEQNIYQRNVPVLPWRI